ncbi:hypothetical protein IXO621_20770, partial [Xanthomonas oryzae pv. oryzae]
MVNHIRNRTAAHGLKGFDDLQDTAAVSCSEIDGQNAGLFQLAQGAQMSGCKIDDMNEVADAGAIRSIVVISPNVQLLTSPDGHLRHKWQQVVGYAERIFSDKSAFVRANRIEVAQDGDPPVAVGSME